VSRGALRDWPRLPEQIADRTQKIKAVIAA
jgi:hypothetical protein